MMARKHRLRALRNLLAAAVLLAFFWWSTGCPLPAGEMEVRRYERTHLINGPSVTVFSCESEGERPLGDPTMLVRVSKYTIQTSSRTHPVNIWPRNPEGATLVVLPSELEYEPNLIVGLVAADPPALAAGAELTIDLTGYEGGKIYAAEGEREGAVFLFRLGVPPDTDNLLLMNLFHTTDLPPYTLEFFDRDGTLLETVTNTDDLGGRS
ncbi:MAG: hypothetical protein K2O45_07230 [Oscillospiraceae bacterium]|nr:hypothetical protein [Oscillospiraceae bacterium]